MSIGGDDYKGSILPILMLRLAPVWRSGEESAAEIEYIKTRNIRRGKFRRKYFRQTFEKSALFFYKIRSYLDLF